MQFTIASIAVMAASVSAIAVTNGTSTSSVAAALATPQTMSCQASYNLCEKSTETGCDTSLTTCQQQCSTTYNTCRTSANSNMATCAAAYAYCLGFNPFSSNGTNTVNPAIAYTTEVVTAFTTYCPAGSAITYNGETYSAGPSTTVVTVTNCPCTVTRALNTAGSTGTVGAAAASGYAASTGSASSNSSSYSPATFTGAGSQLLIGGSSLMAAVGALAFFL